MLEGKDEVRRYMAEAYATPPDFEMTDMIESGEHLTAIGEITLTEGDVSTRFAACDVWRLSDGKLSELRAFVVELEA